jgi:hypothetical protein
MKEQNEIDRLLRDSLDKFRPEPDASRKKKFLDEAALLANRKGITGFNWKWMIISLLFIGLAGAIFFITETKKETPSPEIDGNDVASNDQQNLMYNESLTELENNASDPAVTGESAISHPSTLEVFSVQAILEDQGENNPTIPGSTVLFPDQDFMASEKEESAVNQDLEGREMTSQKNIEMSSHDNLFTIEMSSHDSLTKPEETVDNETNNILPETPESPAKSAGSLSYGLFYKPELLFNIIDNNKLIHAAGADIQYRFLDSRFLIRAGLGISFSKGYNEYIINYNEYMGSYQRLDSVTFTLAENNFTLIPIVHQSEQQVYDTAVQALPSKVYQQFCYLHVPFMAGYDFIRRENYALGFRMGPALSVLLNRNPAAVTYEAGMNQVLAVDSVTPERAVFNWQLAAGLNFTIRGPGFTFVELEPAFSYYLNAMHQDLEENKHPYSIGLRLSFRFR